MSSSSGSASGLPTIAQLKTSDVPASQKQAHLLRIPKELRNEIYQLCLISKEEEPICAGATGRSISLALIYTCRQLYDEGSEFVYGENTFTFGKPAFSSGKIRSSLNVLELGTPLRNVKRWELFIEIPPRQLWEEAVKTAIVYPAGITTDSARLEFFAALSFIKRESRTSSLLLKIAPSVHLPPFDEEKTWQRLATAIRLLFRCVHNHPNHSLLYLSKTADDTKRFYSNLGEFVHNEKQTELVKSTDLKTNTLIWLEDRSDDDFLETIGMYDWQPPAMDGQVDEDGKARDGSLGEFRQPNLGPRWRTITHVYLA